MEHTAEIVMCRHAMHRMVYPTTTLVSCDGRLGMGIEQFCRLRDTDGLHAGAGHVAIWPGMREVVHVVPVAMIE